MKPSSRILIYLPLISILYSCANVVAPQGGPADEDPPGVIRSTPPNFSTNYDGSDVRIYFDEFVQLHNLQQKMLVSPPLKDLPEVRIRRRSIIMSLEENLMDSTTYSFFFGDAIRDITEGNAIPNFRYVVSTGDYVDSLSVRGEVINAFDLKPAEEVFVMMYDDIYDSVPYKDIPVYITRTDENGMFEITNMRKGEYLMFALKDMNFNYIYDQPGEKIAFLDSLVEPEYVEPPASRTVEEGDTAIIEDRGLEEISEDEPADTIQQQTDLPANDSDLAYDEDTLGIHIPPEANFYRMYLFQEKDTIQRISSADFKPPGKMTLTFRIPFDSVHVEEYKEPFDHEWKIRETSQKNDSLFLWLNNVDRDSLHLTVWDREQLIDSISRSIRPREGARTRRRTDDSLMTLTPNQSGRSFHYFENLVITANNPLSSVNEENIIVMVQDSIPVEGSWEITGIAERRVRFVEPFEENTSYSFMIPDSTFTDIYGIANEDTVNISFTTSSVEDYGVILLDLTLPQEDDNYILQLMNNESDVIKERYISGSGNHRFEHLGQGNYYFKVIHDKNNNGKWDTGNYLEGVQPEPVFVLEEHISVRQNWDHEIIWEITDN